LIVSYFLGLPRDNEAKAPSALKAHASKIAYLIPTTNDWAIGSEKTEEEAYKVAVLAPIWIATTDPSSAVPIACPEVRAVPSAPEPTPYWFVPNELMTEFMFGDEKKP